MLALFEYHSIIGSSIFESNSEYALLAFYKQNDVLLNINDKQSCQEKC